MRSQHFAEGAVGDNAAVLADAHEDEAVHEALDGLGEPGRAVVRVGFGKGGLVAAIDFAGEVPAVGVEVGEENLIDRLAALEVDEHPVDGADAAAGLELLDAGKQPFERAAFDGSAAEGVTQDVPLRLVAPVVDGELLDQAAPRLCR